MKCSETNPNETYQECQKELKHSGDHEYYSHRWPRPEPAGLDEDVEDALLAAEHRVPQHLQWSLHKREYLVAFEVTTTYLVRVSAKSEDDALNRYADYCDYPNFANEDAVDGSVEARRLTEWERSDHEHSQQLGPEIACPSCGRLSMHPRWFHDPYKKCHGPIQWKQYPNGRPYRDHVQTPAFAGVQAVAS
ncbi:hypothetical protein ACIPW5_11165 [Streptomyces sp. NPDC090077]|uniref:hypothetical protein n=1 Tax=Streptomyces sp. NPDC090077 TaxID=3365938 RepID=UPI0037F2F128